MLRIHETIEIEAPVESVFEFVADFRNALQWMHGFHEFKPLTRQSSGKGAKVRAAGRLTGVPVVTELEIVEFIPNRRLVSVSNSGLRSTSTWLFEPIARGTRVSFVADYEIPRGVIGRVLGTVWLHKQLIGHTWKSLRNLKRTMEAAHRTQPQGRSNH